MAQWHLIAKSASIVDDFGVWIATTGSVFLAATIVEEHNRKEEIELRQLRKLIAEHAPGNRNLC